MLGPRFYHGLTRKYIAIFGTLFNEIRIGRAATDDQSARELLVPIAYGPSEKFLHRREQDEDHSAPAIVLPRMAFELTSYSYDGERKLNSPAFTIPGVSGLASTTVAPAPYNLEFELSIMTKTLEDGNKIVEQILPYFTPAFTVTAKLIDGVDKKFDLPVVLNAVSRQDSYEGSPEEGRTIVWTLSFTLKGYFFAGKTDRKVIKFAEARLYTRIDGDTVESRVQTWPGLTADGEPTTDPAQAVPYAEVNEDDDWAYIVVIEDE